MESALRIEGSKLAALVPHAASRLAATEAAVVEALKEHGPMTGAELARAVHRSPNGGSLRGELSSLKRRGIIKSGSRGYELP